VPGVADVRDLVRDDQMVLGFDSALHVVADDAGLFAGRAMARQSGSVSDTCASPVLSMRLSMARRVRASWR